MVSDGEHALVCVVVEHDTHLLLCSVVWEGGLPPTVRIPEANKDNLISPSSASPDPPTSVSWAVFRPPPLFWRGLAVVEGVDLETFVLATESSRGGWGIVGTSDAAEPDLVRLKEWLEASFKTGVLTISRYYLPVVICSFPFPTLIT